MHKLSCFSTNFLQWPRKNLCIAKARVHCPLPRARRSSAVHRVSAVHELKFGFAGKTTRNIVIFFVASGSGQPSPLPCTVVWTPQALVSPKKILGHARRSFLIYACTALLNILKMSAVQNFSGQTKVCGVQTTVQGRGEGCSERDTTGHASQVGHPIWRFCDMTVRILCFID